MSVVVPVVSVGSDHVDDERATWLAGILVTPPAGSSVVLTLRATSAPLLVESVLVGSTAAQGWHATFRDETSAAVVTTGLVGSAVGRQTADVVIQQEVGAPTRMWSTAANVTLLLPFAGTIIEPGKSLRVRSTTLATAAHLSASWRCLL